MGVQTLDIGFTTPKRHFLARNRAVWRILRQNRCARLGCSLSQEPPKKIAESLWGAKSRMRRTETPKLIWIKFCMVVDIPDVVTCRNCDDHMLRGLGGGGQISPFPIDFHRRPYNTLALPCECVMTRHSKKQQKKNQVNSLKSCKYCIHIASVQSVACTNKLCTVYMTTAKITFPIVCNRNW